MTRPLRIRPGRELLPPPMPANQMADQNQHHQSGGVGQKGLNQGSNGDHGWLPATGAMEAQASIVRTHFLDFEGCSGKVDTLAPLVDHRSYHRTSILFSAPLKEIHGALHQA